MHLHQRHSTAGSSLSSSLQAWQKAKKNVHAQVRPHLKVMSPTLLSSKGWLLHINLEPQSLSPPPPHALGVTGSFSMTEWCLALWGFGKKTHS